DTSKTVKDPCPAGYRVPTAAQWQAVINNNQIGRVGTWTNSNTNYTSGLNIGGNGNSTLFLPAAGSRYDADGALYVRGRNGYYWSSSEATSYADYLIFFSSNVNVTYSFRTNGNSVRCVAE
ncbi:hypothetical protein CMU59_17605, partial [Elizabethkingia anophelis]|nr:hypothetical protein [Elizabethkingia anophelis]MDV3608587.1 hypothetical protein [Elizabethkingia anophelis]MDV3640460.1 hypothetical protein [Elizabethkingia anophelis]MDV3651485.1 hypothetical protein [Elizabethkingia anophelis]MDV3691870.1 hypothetical protein [Elizabethkingia anophelis]